MTTHIRARLPERPAVVACLQACKLRSRLLIQVRKTPEQRCTFVARLAAPRTESLPRSFDRQIDVSRSSERDVRPGLSRRRIDALEQAAVFRCDPLSPNKESRVLSHHSFPRSPNTTSPLYRVSST